MIFLNLSGISLEREWSRRGGDSTGHLLGLKPWLYGIR